MGSMNIFTVSETGPAKDQMPGSQVEEKREISRLLNSIYYYIEHVYIRKYYGSYRLIAKHYGRTLCDQVYPTLRGARIAFNRLFHYKLWDENAKPKWSHFYIPETGWYEKITPETPPTQPPGGES